MLTKYSTCTLYEADCFNSAVVTSGADSPSLLSACLLGVTVTNGAEEKETHSSDFLTYHFITSCCLWLLISTYTHTNKLLDGDSVEHIKRGVQFERLTAPLTHEADLHGCAGRLGALHR